MKIIWPNVAVVIVATTVGLIGNSCDKRSEETRRQHARQEEAHRYTRQSVATLKYFKRDGICFGATWYGYQFGGLLTYVPCEKIPPEKIEDIDE